MSDVVNDRQPLTDEEFQSGIQKLKIKFEGNGGKKPDRVQTDKERNKAWNRIAKKEVEGGVRFSTDSKMPGDEIQTTGLGFSSESTQNPEDLIIQKEHEEELERNANLNVAEKLGEEFQEIDDFSNQEGQKSSFTDENILTLGPNSLRHIDAPKAEELWARPDTKLTYVFDPYQGDFLRFEGMAQGVKETGELPISALMESLPEISRNRFKIPPTEETSDKWIDNLKLIKMKYGMVHQKSSLNTTHEHKTLGTETLNIEHPYPTAEEFKKFLETNKPQKMDILHAGSRFVGLAFVVGTDEKGNELRRGILPSDVIPAFKGVDTKVVSDGENKTNVLTLDGEVFDPLRNKDFTQIFEAKINELYNTSGMKIGLVDVTVAVMELAKNS